MGRKVLITGASGDLGFATAQLAAEQGWSLALHCRTESSATKLSSAFDGEQTKVFAGDLADSSYPEQLIKEGSAFLDGIDSVIHFAGIQESRPIKTTDADFIKRTLDANLMSTMLLMRAFRDKRIPKTLPSFLMVSSIAAVRGHSGESAYSASKGALLSLVRTYARELSSEGIRVNALVPGAVVGTMTEKIKSKIGPNAFGRLVAAHPLGMGTPEDVASAAIFMVSSQAKWITGTELIVDGGYSA